MIKRSTLAGLAASATILVSIVLSENYTSTAIIPVPGDVPTIGFGTTGGVKMGDVITPPKALARALVDIQKFEGAIKKCVKVPLYQYEYDAYISLSYNIGSGAFCRKANKQRKNPDGTPNPEPDRLIDVLNAGRYEEACARISGFNKAGGRVLKGLTNRRAAERALCEGKQQ